MPPDMAISMRHSKITAAEAALLSGELQKPSWQSKNEGIHERVSFEDCIWGFDLAGGIFYNTPLRVTSVKPDSRAEKAGIRPGDKLKRINDIDTSTLTIQEAHEIIIESGVHLKIAVTAPEDEEDSYHCYQDPIDEAYELEKKRKEEEEERERKRHVHAKVSSYWSLQWPWVSKRRIIYRESNCFMVPSKFESKHKDRFSPIPALRVEDDIVLFNKDGDKVSQIRTNKEPDESIPNGDVGLVNGHSNENNLSNDLVPPSPVDSALLSNDEEEHSQDNVLNLQSDDALDDTVSDLDELSNNDLDSKHEDMGNGYSTNDELDSKTEDVTESKEEQLSNDGSHSRIEDITESREDNDHSTIDEIDSKTEEVTESREDEASSRVKETTEFKEEISVGDDAIINDVLNDSTDVSKAEEDQILNSILSDSATEGNSESLNER